MCTLCYVIVNQKPAELEVLTLQGSGCEGHIGWPCLQGFRLLLWSSDRLLPVAPGPAGVDGETTGTLLWVSLCNATFWVTFLQGSSFPSSDA